MTDDELADIRRHISLMKSIERTTVHLPIATVERLMSTGHKVNVGRGTVKAGKFQKAPPRVSVSDRIGRKAKADRLEAKWLEATSAAYRAGAEAHTKGKTIDDCPHKDGRTTIAKQWREGWTKAFAEARKAARKAKAA